VSAGLTAAVGLLGGLGAVARVALDGALTARWPSTLPWPTLLVNVSGSLLLGLLTGLVLFQGAPDAVRIALGTGFCGGWTTFSTVSVASLRLAQGRSPGLAALNALGTLVLTVLAAAAGLGLGALR
jgi:CrcB protein